MLLYLALGGALLWLLLAVYRRNPGIQRGRWRVGAGLFASVLLGAAGLMASRGQWVAGAVMAALALLLAAGARTQRWSPPPRGGSARDVSLADARALLGVEETATDEEIQAAYTRLMRRAHPDSGGTTGLAAQLNAARDRLLKGRR